MNWLETTGLANNQWIAHNVSSCRCAERAHSRRRVCCQNDNTSVRKQCQSERPVFGSSLPQVSALKHATAETWAATAATARCPGTPAATRPRPDPRGAPSAGMPASRWLMCEVSGVAASARASAADGTSSVSACSSAWSRAMLERKDFQDSQHFWTGSGFFVQVVEEKLYTALTHNKVVIFLSLCVWFSINLNVTGFCHFVTLNSPQQQKT